MPMTKSSGIVKDLEHLVRARYPLIWVNSHEEARVVKAVAEVAANTTAEWYCWACTTGLLDRNDQAKADCRDPQDVLEHILASKERAIYILRDFHPYLAREYPLRCTVIRRLRDIAEHLRTRKKNVILLSPIPEIPIELSKDIYVVDFPLPDREQLGLVLDSLLQDAASSSPGLYDLTMEGEQRDVVISSALGLTEKEAQDAFAHCLVTKRRLDPAFIANEKEQIIRKSGVLEYYQQVKNMGDVGGLDVLKEWLTRREKSFSEDAARAGIPMPRGLLLTGVQGCGKSLVAKAVASLWRMPLLKMDVGRVFGGIVGESEQNVRQATKLAEAVAPCVLWLDEVEKGFAGVESSSQLDSGVTARVFAHFLTWLQEKEAPVFVIATSNRAEVLPAEFSRKGRFDDIFFLDLPSEQERREIFLIHLKRRRRDEQTEDRLLSPGDFDLDALARASENFSGSEIEEAIKDAIHMAYADGGRKPTTADILRALKDTVPLSKTYGEDIEARRKWGHDHARAASNLQAEADSFVRKPLTRPIEVDQLS
jgi:SpoVK/Ycf46/Vps4 family AAA+-type ATPase